MQELKGGVNARFPIGYDVKKTFYQADLLSINHLLIAGATGVGKTVFMDTVLLSLIKNNTPEQIRLILCDTKQIQMQQYKEVNHLLIPLCTKTRYISAVFQAALAETTRRVKLFADSGIKSIAQYNEILMQQYNRCLPRLIIVIDDLSVLLREQPDAADTIKKIISLGRTVGIHLIAITQTPAARDTKDIAAMFVTKAIFQTVSTAERRLLTGSTMQFSLDEAGDYIFMSGSTKIKTHVVPPNEDEMNRIISDNSGVYQYSKIFIREIEGNMPYDSNTSHDDVTLSGGALDPMFDQAVECVIEAGQASTSILQRRLKLGYARAAHIMDQMEQKGIIGPYEGAKPRSILITMDEWHKHKLR